MTPDELLATLGPLAARGPYLEFVDELDNLWPDIAACLERLAAAEAELAELRNRLVTVYGPQWNKHVARRSQP